MYSNKNAIVFSYGAGGHSAQANRLAALLIPRLDSFYIISISDDCITPKWSHIHFVTGEVRKKNSYFDTLTNMGPIKIIQTLLKIKKYNVRCVISNGPGISVITALFFKVFGAKIIHVETWSRFVSKSLTGMAMYYIADVFYVQNKELCKIYKNAIYSGRL